MKQKIIKTCVFCFASSAILVVIALTQAKTPNLVLIGQTASEATVTIIYNGAIETITAEKNGFFKKEVFDLLPRTYSATVYAEKNGTKSEEKSFTFIVRADVITTISDIELKISGNGVPKAPPCLKTGDLNFDTLVDFRDFSIFLNRWNTDDCEADLNSDGNVGLIDFGILLTRMGTSIVSVLRMLVSSFV